MADFDDTRLRWEDLDPLVLAGAKVRFIKLATEMAAISIPQALDLLVQRYELLRRSRPGDFTMSPEDYWKGFYS